MDGRRSDFWAYGTICGWAAQRRHVTEMACFLCKNRDLSIKNSLKLVECTLAPLLAFSVPVIIWPEKERKQLTAAFVRCNKKAWHMSPNTSTALFTFPRDEGVLRIKMPRAIMCPAVWGHLTRCCRFDDGTRQLVEITYQDALKNHGCLDMEDLQFEAEYLTWDQASQNTFTFACHLTSMQDLHHALTRFPISLLVCAVLYVITFTPLYISSPECAHLSPNTCKLLFMFLHLILCCPSPYCIPDAIIKCRMTILISYLPCLAARFSPHADCSIRPLAPLFAYLRI